MRAKFRCTQCWGTDPIEYVIRRGLDLLKPVKDIIDYTDDDTVIIEGNLHCPICMEVAPHTLSRWGRGFRCDECDFKAGLGFRSYDDGEFRRSPAPRQIKLGAPDPTENMHCNECGQDRRHVAAYDDRLFHYLYICTECRYVHE